MGARPDVPRPLPDIRMRTLPFRAQKDDGRTPQGAWSRLPVSRRRRHAAGVQIVCGTHASQHVPRTVREDSCQIGMSVQWRGRFDDEVRMLRSGRLEQPRQILHEMASHGQEVRSDYHPLNAFSGEVGHRL